MRVLVQFFHPALEKSRVQVHLAEAARKVAQVEFRDLYELYPDFDVDVRREQRVMERAELVIFQHPLYWYSGPALMKQWLDLVLEHGWAYGSEGRSLRGKHVLHVISSGGSQEAYGPNGMNRHPLSAFLLPLAQTAALCGMEWVPPYCITGTHRLQAGQIQQAAQRYGRLLEALAAGWVDLQAVKQADRPESAWSGLGEAYIPVGAHP